MIRFRFLRAFALLVAGAATACSRETSLPQNWVTVPDRAAHDAFFPIATGVHGAAACNDCHGAFDTFKMFDCLTCHDQFPALTQASLDPAHGGVAGYTYASASCYQCHPRGIGGAPANHTPSFFPIGAGTAHATVGCSQCHTNLATPTDPATLGCYTCHSTLPSWPGHTASVTVTTLTGPVNIPVAIPTVHTSRSASTQLDMTNPANCLRCHADSQVDLVSSHPTGDRALGGNDSHDGAGCATCHSTFRTDKPFGADFASQVAQPCFTSAPPGCVTCHPGPPPCGG